MGKKDRAQGDKMSILFSLLGIFLFVLGLLITVGLHELGHLIPAKKFGVKVPKYFIGFGSTLWSIKRAGTEYGLKVLPLGGFVQLAGMLPPAREGVRKHKSNGELTLAEQARQDSAAELEPGEESQAFWRLPAHKKLVVMFGGPCINVLLSVLLIVGVMCGIGVGTYGTTISQVPRCISAEESCADNDRAPASLAGFQPGDCIYKWNGTPVATWKDVQEAIVSGGVRPADVLIEREGKQITLNVTPIETERPVVSGGAVVTDPETGQAKTDLKPYVGLSPQIELQRTSVGTALAQAGKLAAGTVQIVAVLPAKLWQIFTTLLSGAPRDSSSVVGIVGVAHMAGTITSAQAEGYNIAQRAADFLMLMASLNMSLFIFNMIPLLPLDGGHILGALIEGVRSTIARWRGKADPGAFDTARLLPLSYAVIAFFVLMTVLLVVADIVNPVGG